MRLLIVYGTTEGHTKLIAARVAEVATGDGHRVETLHADAVTSPLDLYWFDAVMLGASVHQGHHQSSVREFVLANRERLEHLPSAFFSVSLSAAVKDETHQSEAQGYIDALLHETGWQPQMTASFAGALRHAEYDYFKKLVLKMLAGQLGPGVIRGEDVVYTDWAAVEAFTRSFLDLASGAERGGDVKAPRSS